MSKVMASLHLDLSANDQSLHLWIARKGADRAWVSAGDLSGRFAAVAVALTPNHPHDRTDAAARGGPFDEHHQIDGLSDGAIGHALGPLADQVLQTRQGLGRAVRVDRGETAGVAGIPGLEQIQGRSVAHLADDD